MKSAKEILAAVGRRRGLGGQNARDLVLCLWAPAVGPQIASRTRPIRLLGRRLVVDVEGHEWRRQLASISSQIVAQLNRTLGEEIVEGIDFRVMAPAARPPQRAGTISGEPLDEAAGIEDPNLRRIYRASKRRVKKRAASAS